MITIHQLGPNDVADFLSLLKIFEVEFEMEGFQPPAAGHLQSLLNRDGFLVFVAKKDGAVAGGLTVYTLPQYYSIRPLAYIFDLAVTSAEQRQGIGTQLMSAVTDYCRAHGYEEVFVQADRVDHHAVQFYTRTGGRAEDVLHFTYPTGE